MKTLSVTLAILLAGSLLVSAEPSAKISAFHLEGNRLTLSCANLPLEELLEQFAYAGVRVKIDPQIKITVTGACRDVDVEAALNDILSPLGYALIWDVVEGPLGPIPRLAEIQVFRRGRRRYLKPLTQESDRLQVTSGPAAGSPLYVKDEILLAVSPGTTLEEFEHLMRQVGGTVVDCIPELGIYRIRLSPGTNIPALVDQLSHNPLLSHVEPDYVVAVPAPTATPTQSPPAATVKPPSIPDGAVPVAVLDSGIKPAAGFEDVVVGTYNALDPQVAADDPLGHGTQMALLAAGLVSPAGTGTDENGVPVIAVRAFDQSGYASFFGIMRSLDYAARGGARVVNMSWGTQTRSEFLARAMAHAASQGLILVAAAGNRPTGRPLYPAAFPEVIAVSAAGTDGKPWKQSNYGSFINLAAPGQASFPVGYRGPPGAYEGTSISSAYLTHVLGLYFLRHPKASPQKVLGRLHAALSPLNDPRYGSGLLDPNAVRRFLEETPTGPNSTP